MQFRSCRCIPRFLMAIGLAAFSASMASAQSNACANRVNNTPDKLLECVTLEAVRGHQAALQAIADANSGNRTSGTPGFNASVDYVVNRLTQAGYTPTVQEFQYQGFVELVPSLLAQISPAPAGPIVNNILSYSGNGDVTAPAVNVVNFGCDPADFAGFPAGSIALISRGACTFALKATNAYNAGASGVVIYNNVPALINGTLGNSFNLNIPVVSVTQAAGTQLAFTPGLVLRIRTNAIRGLLTSYNVLAETKDGDPDKVLMAGASLDSPNSSPGINRNGSAVAALLETAVQMSKVKPQNKVRFAWWGATNSGLQGSFNYLSGLSAQEKTALVGYVDFSNIGSPNFVYFILDGDDSDGVGVGPGPAGSAEIEKVFEDFYTARNLPYQGTDLFSGSDSAGFLSEGIAVGGISAGSGGIKTPLEAATWGGTAGAAYDPCSGWPVTPMTM